MIERHPVSPTAYARRLRYVVERVTKEWTSRSIDMNPHAHQTRDRFDFAPMRAELHSAIEEEFRHDIPPRKDQAEWALAGVLTGIAVEVGSLTISLDEVLIP